MYYSEELGLVYLAHPRTASKSTAWALQRQYGFVQGSGHHEALPDVTMDVPDDWTVMTTVRNHFDALVSWQALPHQDSVDDFSVDWIKALLSDGSRALRYLPGAPHRLWDLHRPHADVVLRFESLGDDLEAVLPGAIELDHYNKSQFREGTHYSDFYTPELRRFVEGLFWEEMDELGYRFMGDQDG